MNWRNVRLLFLREVRDQLRDRRTLFMIAVLPLLLYPSLGIGVMQMQFTRSEAAKTVVVLGEDQLPEPALIEGDHFVKKWFGRGTGAGAGRLRVVTESSLDRAAPEERGEVADRLAAARSVREVQREYEAFDRLRDAAKKAGDEAAVRRIEVRMEAAERRRSDLLAGSGIQVLILVPEGMRDKLEAANARLRDGGAGGDEVEVPSPAILYNPADQKALGAFGLVAQAYGRWKAELVRERLRLAHLPESFPSQIDAKTVDVAREDERSRAVWSKIFPALLVIMTLTGAFYPAVDLAAGEKERGTMETLLICPASRTEIVLGKFLTVLLFSVCTALLNLASMGLTGRYLGSIALAGAGPQAALLSPPPASSLVWVVVLLLPLASLFSALCLALATFARSSKEGQYYLTPLLLVTVGLTIYCLLPDTELNPFLGVSPVVGVALLLRELLAGSGGYSYLAPVLVTNLGYAALALWWAIEQFNSEEVLFREAERFDLRLWVRHLLRDKEDTPSFGESGFCFVLIMLLQFGAMKVLGEAARLGDVSESARGTVMLRLMMVQQIAIVATPALLMGVMLTRSVRKTFRLRLPGPKFLVAGALLPLALQPLSYTLARRLEWFFPPLPESVVEAMKLMGTDKVPAWLALLAFAAAPAVCEEIAFRGFILSGFLRSRRTWLAIGLSGLAFGAMHMVPQQAFNAALLGLVLGLLAVRSGSLWPGVLFHFLFNGSQVLLSRVDAETLSGRWGWLVSADGDGMRYTWPVLVVCAVTAVLLLRWLTVTPSRTVPHERRAGPRPAAAPARLEDAPAGVV